MKPSDPGHPAAQPPLKPLVWIGGSKKDLKALPAAVVDVIGYGLYLSQRGLRHSQCKTLRGFGDGSVIEIVEDHIGNTYRAVYTVRFAEAVFVLHVFQKKSTRGAETPKPEMNLIAARLKRAAEIAKEMAQ